MNSASSDSTAPNPRGGYGGLGLVFLIIFAAAAALRLIAAQDEFWLDEIWSLAAFVQTPHAFREVFTFHHDNNHYLVTMWMDLLGPQQRNWVLYRVPSIVAGMGTVILAACFARQWGRWAALSAGLLTASSFVLILYASEARGYALAGFFSLVALLAVDHYLRATNWLACTIFAIATMLGILSHLTFVQFYAGTCAWSLAAMLQQAAPWRQRITRLVALHAFPFCLLLGLYFLDVRDMRIGGGDDYRMPDVIARALALAVGGWGEGSASIAISAVFAGLIGLSGILALWREKSPMWAFFAGGFIATPALLFALKRPTLLYERYFYLNTIYFLILLSYLFARCLRGGKFLRGAAIATLMLVVLGNVKLTADFLHVGRGHYLAALEYINEQTPGPVIHLAGDDDFDNTHYLGFYVNYLPPGRQFTYTNFRRGVDAANPPEWLLVHSQQRPFRPESEFLLPGTDGYRLIRTFPCGRLSGYQFALYRRN